ncbi:MAG: ABC transporter ATP-binding protein [Clostridia bacterium]|nr:ABC transporter ATP-binding protein [Clostridia bacterium]
MQPVLELKQISKKIKKRDIVIDINLKVFPGEVMGFLGPNGAGKTTTIRMITGLIRPTSGDIYISGHHVHQHRAQAMAQLGTIVENPELYKFLTGRQNLQQFARMAGHVGPGRIAEISEMVGLTGRIDDKVRTYSLGMRQRLGLAQALLHRPRLLVLDEPTNGMDPQSMRELREMIRKLAREEGIGVFISSHQLAEVQQVADRVAIIDKGLILRVESLEQLANEGRQQLVVTVNKPQQAATLCSQLVYCHGVKVEEDRIIMELEPERTPELVRELVRAEIDVYELTRRKFILEDKFIDVTGGDIHV